MYGVFFFSLFGIWEGLFYDFFSLVLESLKITKFVRGS